jgi:2-polyprenyl-3-methyl-5-hydroxy-6-metoxy-1,4-benzoquinol methylase
MADAAGDEVGPASGRDYALQRSATERRRLVLQERVIGPSTARFFDDAGLRRGMRVLDVGSGAGDVAMLVARTVGPTGSVVGVDIDDASVETARQRAATAALANVKFVTADVAHADLGSGFDAVVGRLVLMHVPDPVLVLRRVVSALRPGGLVAFQEAHLESPWLSYPISATLQRVQRARSLALQGGQPVNSHMGLALRSTFVRAGIGEPEIRTDLVVGGPHGWEGHELVEETVRSLLPGWLRLGIDGAERIAPDGLAARLREELGDHGSLMLYPLIGAWTHRRS